MGTVLVLQSIADPNIQAVLRNPPLIWRFLEPDSEELYLQAVEVQQRGFFSRLFGRKLIRDEGPEALEYCIACYENLRLLATAATRSLGAILRLI